ncbi:MAG: hypothetical protein H0X31_02790 [Nostocaceae cyanobacterium]|nr:hypothetical protein [Nostocaceae cyanobacterium]
MQVQDRRQADPKNNQAYPVASLTPAACAAEKTSPHLPATCLKKYFDFRILGAIAYKLPV